eukprot:scaffold97026_cov36-Phaeocystis_antarctica.AAC.1
MCLGLLRIEGRTLLPTWERGRRSAPPPRHFTISASQDLPSRVLYSLVPRGGGVVGAVEQLHGIVGARVAALVRVDPHLVGARVMVRVMVMVRVRARVRVRVRVRVDPHREPEVVLLEVGRLERHL